VEARQVATELAPDLRRRAGLEVEGPQCFAPDALDDQVGDGQQVERVVEDDDRRSPYAGRPSRRCRYGLAAKLVDVSRVIAGDAQNEVIAKPINRVDNASGRQQLEPVGG